MKHYLSNYEENYLDGDLKSETFDLTQTFIRKQIKNKTHNFHNLLDLSGSLYF